jgi:hypothetical protein
VNDFFNAFAGQKAQVVLAGAAGGLVRWLTLRSAWRDGTISVIVGSISALYLGPLAEPAIDALLGTFVADPASRYTFSGFIIGLGGVSVSGFVMDFWRARRHKMKDGDDEN